MKIKNKKGGPTLKEKKRGRVFTATSNPVPPKKKKEGERTYVLLQIKGTRTKKRG